MIWVFDDGGFESTIHGGALTETATVRVNLILIKNATACPESGKRDKVNTVSLGRLVV